MRVSELAGRTFGKLTVVYHNGSKRGLSLWHVKCECGKEKDVLGTSLLSGNTLSCGGIQKQRVKEGLKRTLKKLWSDPDYVESKRQSICRINTKHGARKREFTDPLYVIWAGIKNRCNHNVSYTRKNIPICEEWGNSFELFRKWALANGYVKGKHIDRKSNHEGYNPDNCQFLEPDEHHKKSAEETRQYFAQRRLKTGN